MALRCGSSSPLCTVGSTAHQQAPLLAPPCSSSSSGSGSHAVGRVSTAPSPSWPASTRPTTSQRRAAAGVARVSSQRFQFNLPFSLPGFPAGKATPSQASQAQLVAVCMAQDWHALSVELSQAQLNSMPLTSELVVAAAQRITTFLLDWPGDTQVPVSQQSGCVSSLQALAVLLVPPESSMQDSTTRPIAALSGSTCALVLAVMGFAIRRYNLGIGSLPLDVQDAVHALIERLRDDNAASRLTPELAAAAVQGAVSLSTAITDAVTPLVDFCMAIEAASLGQAWGLAAPWPQGLSLPQLGWKGLWPKRKVEVETVASLASAFLQMYRLYRWIPSEEWLRAAAATACPQPSSQSSSPAACPMVTARPSALSTLTYSLAHLGTNLEPQWLDAVDAKVRRLFRSGSSSSSSSRDGSPSRSRGSGPVSVLASGAGGASKGAHSSSGDAQDGFSDMRAEELAQILVAYNQVHYTPPTPPPPTTGGIGDYTEALSSSLQSVVSPLRKALGVGLPLTSPSTQGLAGAADAAAAASGDTEDDGEPLLGAWAAAVSTSGAAVQLPPQLPLWTRRSLRQIRATLVSDITCTSLPLPPAQQQQREAQRQLELRPETVKQPAPASSASLSDLAINEDPQGALVPKERKSDDPFSVRGFFEEAGQGSGKGRGAAASPFRQLPRDASSGRSSSEGTSKTRPADKWAALSNGMNGTAHAAASSNRNSSSNSGNSSNGIVTPDLSHLSDADLHVQLSLEPFDINSDSSSNSGNISNGTVSPDFSHIFGTDLHVQLSLEPFTEAGSESDDEAVALMTEWEATAGVRLKQEAAEAALLAHVRQADQTEKLAHAAEEEVARLTAELAAAQESRRLQQHDGDGDAGLGLGLAALEPTTSSGRPSTQAPNDKSVPRSRQPSGQAALAGFKQQLQQRERAAAEASLVHASQKLAREQQEAHIVHKQLQEAQAALAAGAQQQGEVYGPFATAAKAARAVGVLAAATVRAEGKATVGVASAASVGNAQTLAVYVGCREILAHAQKVKQQNDARRAQAAAVARTLMERWRAAEMESAGYQRQRATAVRASRHGLDQSLLLNPFMADL